MVLLNNRKNWVKGVMRYCAGPVWSWSWALVIGCIWHFMFQRKISDIVPNGRAVSWKSSVFVMCGCQKWTLNMLMTAHMLSNVVRGKCCKFPANRPKPTAARRFVEVFHSLSVASLEDCLCGFSSPSQNFWTGEISFPSLSLGHSSSRINQELGLHDPQRSLPAHSILWLLRDPIYWREY